MSLLQWCEAGRAVGTVPPSLTGACVLTEVWSRGAVVDPVGPQVLVRLLDVGRQERVPPERLRQMPPQVSRLAPGSLLLAFRGQSEVEREG